MAEVYPQSTFFRWRLTSGARTPWQPVPMRYVAVPNDAEGVEFHEGEPGPPPRRKADQSPASSSSAA